MKLAILGHESRGKEVIEILEMLGGKNPARLQGTVTNMAYYICAEGYLEGYIATLYEGSDKRYKVFTLEEFLAKYPYKVGDKVIHSDYESPLEIVGMKWENDLIQYEVYTNDYGYWFSVDELQPYKEETMDKVSKAVFDTNAQCCNIMNHLINEETMEDKGTLVQIDLTRELCVADEVEVILGDYEFVLKDGKTYFIKKKPKYPKTYEECCDIIGYPHNVVGGYKAELLSSFQNLLICRDVYWKIEGWNPKIKGEKFYMNSLPSYLRDLLPMPTEELRDAFRENFEDLIEACKKLLYGDGI